MFRTSLLGLTLAAVVALSAIGCGDADCIILVNGGNKLCGDDAKAWCDSTDSLRSAASGLGGNTGDSQNACDAMRSRQSGSSFWPKDFELSLA